MKNTPGIRKFGSPQMPTLEGLEWTPTPPMSPMSPSSPELAIYDLLDAEEALEREREALRRQRETIRTEQIARISLNLKPF
jgi:hypothetical protein